MTTTELPSLLDPETFADGHPAALYRWLHEHAPVYWHEQPNGLGYWVVAGHELVCRVGRDHETFSSEPTIMIDSGEQRPADDDGAAAAAAALGDHKMMLMADPPYHTRLRRLISRDFTPRSIGELRARIDHLAAQVVDEVIEAGTCDLVPDLAGEMPSYLIADLLGIPLDDGRELYQLTETLHSSSPSIDQAAKRAALGEMFAYAAQVYDGKRDEPAELDLSTRIIQAEVDGDRLDMIDFCLFFVLLVDAGGDTTRNLIAGGMLELLRHPDQLDLLRSDLDARLPAAVEEMLRFVSPVIYMRRTATANTELGGHAIAAGDSVVMYYGAANRDPAVFRDPDTFDIGRDEVGKHIAFGGGGPHFCLGANLARLEIEAMFRQMLTRLDDLRLAGPVTYLESVFVSGPTSMPVRFTPGPRGAIGDHRS
ncbi:MAG: cytochrome P450 [Actinomycetota bacterium]